MNASTKAPSDQRVEVAEHCDDSAFRAMETGWNDLVRDCGDQALFRHEALRVWLDCFAPDEPLRLLTLRDGDARLQAALPLLKRRVTHLGVPVTMLCSPSNVHSCRFDLLARDPEVAVPALASHLAAADDWDVMRLSLVPGDGRLEALVSHLQELGHPVGRLDDVRSPYLALPPTREALKKLLKSKFRANLRRRWRRLEEQGEVVLERIDGGSELQRAVAEALELENSGWKAEEGTAIAQDPTVLAYYRSLAAETSRSGIFALWFLRLDGQPLAMQYALEHGGRYLLLKTAYDEDFRKFSPGQLLTDHVMRDCVDRGLREFDFLGPDMGWKQDWADHLRPHSWLYVYRATRVGRAMRSARFRWIPKIKGAVKPWMR